MSGTHFWLGTDDQGRDMLSAIFYGLRTSLAVGAMSGFIALCLGACIGLTAAYFGGRVDTLIMRLVDLQLSFPAILIALVLLAILGKGVDKIIIALIAVQWAYYARTVRGSALVERSKDYIEAAHCLALSNRRIVFRHLLPNVLPPLSGGTCHPARGNPFVSGYRAAHYQAILRPFNRQWLRVYAERQVLDQFFPGRCAAYHHRQH
jgi:peptide/nickel transport system permease protein